MARSFVHTWPGGHVENMRGRTPASVPDLLAALARIRGEAGALAERAYEAIQHHSFDGYRQFCEKRAEHAALASVLQAHIGPKPADTRWIENLRADERGLLTVSIQACVKFAFALSANPLMPMGSRETFVNELGMLRAARDQLTLVKDEEGIAAVLDDLETALMLLEEVLDRSPALDEL